MPIEISPRITIPDRDLTESFVRSAGPGGQNVNKVASAVQLRFDLAGSAALAPEVKARLRALAGRRLTDEDSILIIARNHRTQEQNRREAAERLRDLIQRALIAPRPRKPTRPTRASRERRMETKTRQQRTKGLRGKIRWED
ncbi:MAG TPA: alternative ribosome rescue aminoacyl-tRNA hydrolase ArfB [Steroidobacteraceae bacterium]